MPILKSEIRNKYTTIPNSIIQECELSDGDFRLLVFLYSLPDGWRINQGYLGTKMKCSRININKKIKRIKEAGYLEILKAKGSSTDYIYVLKERDVSVNDVSLGDVSSRDVSLSDTHINTNIINTELINNDLNISSSCYERIEADFGRTLSPTEFEKINQWIEEFNEDITLYAFNIAVLNGVKTFKYVEGILNNWKSAGYKTKQDILDNEKKIEEERNKSIEELFDYNWLDEEE